MTNPVELVIKPRTRDLGSFEVARVLPHAKRRMVGPFIFFDRMGPSTFAPGVGIDVRPHPHIGLATVTYLFQGEIMHRDSLGYAQPIRPGDVNWMYAGRGIVHSERTREEILDTERTMFGIQSWLALPKDKERGAPYFRHHPGATLPEVESNGVHMRLIAGTAYGMDSPVAVASPMFYLDVNITAGAVLNVTDDYPERAVYVVQGQVAVAGETYNENNMLVLAEEADVTVEAPAGAHVMLLGGDPIDGERIIWWNLVASSQDLIEQAKEDWKEGRFDMIEGDAEFIPLPEN
ncbi:MAG: pirin family protein [Alphaproteobacteria bacterium]|jgi:redox-sensitive bicupin YhaK (pirin superfamily)